ncbi:MAG: aldo/keto reductase, partial [Erysipelotrichaceae bacterium]|nr:aldo/keto reductase [Erysipelotrichaceae bacterium]
MAGKVKESFQESLERLQTDYVDCFLVHWPVQGYQQAWLDLIDLYEQTDRVRAIGVSNFEPRHLDKLDPRVKPVINQIESHPRLLNQALIDEILKRDIPVSAYRPLGGWRPEDSVLQEEPVLQLAEKYGKTPAQIVLRWHVQRGLIPVAKSAKKERIEANFQIFDFMLSGQDMKTIEAMNTNRSTVNVMNPVAD